MPSSYSSNLRLELIGSGEQPTTWGNTTNNNLGTLLESAITGAKELTSWTGGDYTLTTLKGAADEARNMTLIVPASLPSTGNIIIPAVPKLYVVYNNSDTYAVGIKVKGSSTVVTIAAKSAVVVFSDGVVVRSAYTLPPATDTVLGGIKVGNGLAAETDGTLNVIPATSTDIGGVITSQPGISTDGSGNLSLDPATNTDIGGVVVGDTLDVALDGTVDLPTIGTITPNHLYSNANVTVDAQGRVIALADGTTGGVTSVSGVAPITVSNSTPAAPVVSFAYASMDSNDDVFFDAPHYYYTTTAANAAVIGSADFFGGISYPAVGSRKLTGGGNPYSPFAIGQAAFNGTTSYSLYIGETGDMILGGPSTDVLDIGAATTNINSALLDVDSSTRFHSNIVHYNSAAQQVELGDVVVTGVGTYYGIMATNTGLSGSTYPILGLGQQNNTNTVAPLVIWSDKNVLINSLANSVTAASVVNASSGGFLTTNAIPSDIAFKENVETVGNALDKTLALNPVYFDWKDKEAFNDKRQLGFIAQEVQPIVPEVMLDAGDNKLGVDYPKLVALLTGAIQELNAKVELLERMVFEEN